MERENFTGERFIPGIQDEELTLEHIQRYESIRELVSGKVVLDAACGEGYGSRILSEYAQKVVGLDISADTIKRAQINYIDAENLQFVQGSIAQIPLEDESIDIVVSFETIEHVTEELQNGFLLEVKRVLKQDGILIISTPNKKIYSDLHNYHNEYHIKEFYENEFVDFLSNNFRNIKLFYQFFEVACIIDNKSNNSQKALYNLNNEYEGEGKYIIALASNKELEEINLCSVCLGKEAKYQNYIDRIMELQYAEIERNDHIRKLDDEIAKKDASIAEKDASIAEKDASIAEKDAGIAEKNANIARLLEIEHLYQQILNSKGWKLVSFPGKIFEKAFPVGTPRRVRLSMLYKYLKAFNRTNVKFVFDSFKAGGFKQVRKELSDFKYRMSGVMEIPTDISNLIKLGEITDISQCDKLIFKKNEEPIVSVVIPVYNQFTYTYNCLKAILAHSGEVSYEVIIADDVSDDLTMKLSEVTENINIVRNSTNMGFLCNCNNAAQYATGKYILFLNNDTQVQENWLQPLIDLIERDSTIGLVGSKLIYPNGTLQEAGGIIWGDGHAWNYGHGQNPDKSEFNYVKEVDYISGASIMIRKSLWKEIGGFDEYFSPAYCEDDDLAFEVRKRGYKVMYQPLSVVVHFEGKSNGTDISTGIKKYQAENLKKLSKKWEKEFKQLSQTEADLFHARDKSQNKKAVLVVDHYVPQYDKDAGGKCTYLYLKMFVRMGLKVTFIPDNFYKSEPYTTELTQMGIEVLYGNYYYNNWQSWLKQNAHFFDYIYLQRPHISIKYIDIVREYSGAKIFYFAHDLHHLREQREYELTGDKHLLESAQKWKNIEYELFTKADVGHVVGSYEQQLMQDIFKDKPIRNIPLYIFEDILKDINKDFSVRSGIIYVGGFGHPPNVDAVLWFGKEVFPLIHQKNPKIKWHVVGSKPPKEVQDLASDNVIIEGFLTDEQLDKMYRECRMAIVPLRVGAGVKGKVVEAAYYQIPLVTTPIGAEGISLKEDAFEVVECEISMADRIVALYDDLERLRELSDNSVNLIKNHYMVDAAYNVLKLDMDK